MAGTKPTRGRRAGARHPGPASSGPASPAPGTPVPAHRIGRRRPLPNGRAVLGGVLVAVAALGMFVVTTSGRDGPRSSYVVADRTLTVGDIVTSSDIRLEAMELGPGPRARAFDATAPLVGAIVVAPIAEGELVQAGALAEAAPEPFEVALALEADRVVNGDLEAGDRVDVVVTYGTGADATTTIVSRAALVEARPVALDRFGDGGFVVTLGTASSDMALAVIHADRAGEVTLVRSTGGLAPPSDRGATGATGTSAAGTDAGES